MNKKLLIGLGIFFVIVSVIAFAPTEKPNREHQQQDFLKIYEEDKSNVYHSRRAFYFSNNLLTIAPRDSLYNLFKDSEDMYKKCSAYYALCSSFLPSSLKEFKKDFEQSFSELANSCVILQDYSKYMADFINTNSLESSRKAQEALEQKPFKIMANAASRLVFGVGEKIGIDTDSFSKEYKIISERVIEEFEAEFGKITK